MSSDPEKTIGDFVTLIRGTTYKGNLVGQPGPALLGLGSIQPGGGFRDADYKTYGGECPEKLMVVSGDLFAALKGATKDGKMIGSVARVPSSIPAGRLTQDTVRLQFRSRNKRIENYIYWVLQAPQYREYCAGRAMGSAVVALSREDFLSYPVPPITPSKVLAVEVLEEIEKRMALLRETNTTLEAIAQALFKSWFVDFDPVHAKQQGRVLEGMDEATASLFPDSFEESELGLVPKGWRIGSVYEIATVTYGAPFASSKFNSDRLGKGLIRIRDLKDESPGIYTEEIHPKGYLVRPGDIVVGMDGEFRAYVWGGEPSWLNQRLCVFLPTPPVPHAFVRFSVMPLLAAVEASETATTVIHLGKNDIDCFRVRIPSKELLVAFGAVVNPLYQKIVLSKQIVANLSSIRDTLLPRLISGQLHLPEASSVS